MTIFNYSGRGRGGGGRWSVGSGRGRGRGGHSTSRPMVVSSATSWVRGGDSSGRGRGQVGNSGGRSNQWVRPREENNAPKAETLAVSSSFDRTTADAAPKGTMMKRGAHQLILKKDVATLTRKESISDSSSSSSGGGKAVEQKIKESAANGEDFKKDANKISNRSDSREEIDDHKNEDDSDSADQKKSVSNAPALQRVGRHKLVLKNATKNEESSIWQTSKDQVSTEAQHLDAGRNQTKVKTHLRYNTNVSGTAPMTAHSKPRRQQGARSHFHPGRPMAKRIRLNNPEDGAADNSSDDSKGYSDGTAEPRSEAERLSDFAYHETGRTVGHFQNRTWKAGQEGSQPGDGAGPRKMGLIRAKPSMAPICPTYAMGVECTNQFCRKRHDIPQESAVPFCSFFQRHGQCLKEDCKFRHIKINPRATVCPSFSLLGFCEDSKCNMNHAREHPKARPDKDKKLPAHGKKNKYNRRT